MLNFRAKPSDPLAFRLNAVLLTHRDAPALIARQIADWLDDNKLPSAVSQLNLVRDYEIYATTLMRHGFRDALERNFLQLKGSTRLHAEYGILRRLCSLFTRPSYLLFELHERSGVLNGLNEAVQRLEHHRWSSGPFGCIFSPPAEGPSTSLLNFTCAHAALAEDEPIDVRH